jgi:AcrR family transcriptional regulator
MVDTPWGRSESLRARRLPPGPGTPAEDVARNQRGRLFGAMVASVAERGYPATRLSDLTELSGVSRNSFYRLFADKKGCFVATMEAMLGGALEALTSTTPRGSWEEQVRNGAAAFAVLFAAQPAAARMCLMEAHAVGPEGLKPFEQATATFEGWAMQAASEAPEQAAMPAEMISAQVGALVEIGRSRLRLGSEAQLPSLMPGFADLLLSYRPPPEPLRLTARPPTPPPETIDAHDHAERALRALAAVAAEHGYANTTVPQIVNRASMSPTTFYANFRDKEDALIAAIDSAGAQIVAAIMPAFRRNQDWAQGVRAALGALFNFLASRPALAQLVMVEVYAAGPDAVARREEALRPLEILLAEGRARSPQVPAIATEVIPGGIFALAYRQIRDSGPESLPSLAPFCTYFTLAPFIGAEEAGAVANGVGQGGGSPPTERLHRLLLSEMMVILAVREAGPKEMARQLGKSVEEVERAIDELLRVDLLTLADAGVSESEERLYRTKGQWLTDADWAQMSLAERQGLSKLIGRLVTGEVELALETGTFDARIDRYLTRVPLLVDEQGWRRLMSIHEKAFHASIEAQAEATERLKQASKPPPIYGRSVQILFELPGSGPDLGGDAP